MHSDKERARARQLSAESVAAGDATGWFERLYAEAEAGVCVVPWADGLPEAWAGAFDLVMEAYTVQPLYGPARAGGRAAAQPPDREVRRRPGPAPAAVAGRVPPRRLSG